MKAAYVDLRVRATDIYLLLMATVFLLFTGMDGYILLEEKKLALFAVITCVWLLFLAVCTVRAPEKGGRRFKPDCTVLLSAAFMAACIISTVCSAWLTFPYFGTGQYNNVFTYLLYALVFSGSYLFGRVRPVLLYGFMAAYSVCCAISVVQLLGYNPLGLFPNGLNYWDPFVQEMAPFLGTVGNIDLMSAVHCLAVPMAAVYLLIGHGRRRFILFVPFLLGIVCVFGAKVASGVLALTATALILCAALPSMLYQRYNCFAEMTDMQRMISGAVPVISISAGILLVLKFCPFSKGTLFELHQVMNGVLSDEFGSSRIVIWKHTLKVIAQYPVCGVGPGCLGNVLDIRFDRYSEALGTLLSAGVDDAHNEYLNYAACFGVLGILPLVLLHIRTWILFAKGKACRYTGHLTLGAGYLCYSIQAFFNIGSCITTPLICIVWGLFLGAVKKAGNLKGDKLKIKAACGCTVGKGRPNNQDNFYFCDTILRSTNRGLDTVLSFEQELCNPVVLGVFDGMGGEHSGEVAAYIAARELKDAVSRNAVHSESDIADFCKLANRRICDYASANVGGTVASTAVILLAVENKVSVINIGDSKCFWIRNGKVEQVTTDHNDRKLMELCGILGRSPRLTQHLGIPECDMIIEPSIWNSRLYHGDSFLLCSDGLTDVLTVDDIKKILDATFDPSACVDRLINAVLSGSGHDNTTVIYGRIETM